MSADNWAVCPKCLAAARAKRAAAAELAESAYGVKPVEEFDRLRALANVPIIEEDLRTLREDYDVGIWGSDTDPATADFNVGYSAHCDTCGFAFHYKHKRQVFPEAEHD
jgi:hypothetical protein